MEAKRSDTYQAYLLRLWRASEDKPWRVTVKPVDGQDQEYNFSDLESAFDFLRKQIALKEKATSPPDHL